MNDTWWVIAGLAVATFTIRMSGVLLGEQLPTTGPWARALKALPGCLIVSLVAVLLLGGGPAEWIAGAIALGVAIVTRTLPVTMVAGIGAIYLLRQTGTFLS